MTRAKRWDDSAKNRVLMQEPSACCSAVVWDMRIVGYVVSIDGCTIASGMTAREAWKNAEDVFDGVEE